MYSMSPVRLNKQALGNNAFDFDPETCLKNRKPTETPSKWPTLSKPGAPPSTVTTAIPAVPRSHEPAHPRDINLQYLLNRLLQHESV